MANQWFKFYGGEYLSDPKIESLTATERSCWITLMCLASNSSNEGIIKYLTIESLLNKSGIQLNPYDTEEWDNSLSVLVKFQKMKMIEIKEDGNIIILNWDKRQERMMTNAQRQAKYRENKKSNEKVTRVTTKVTLEENRIEENRIDKNTYGDFKNVLLTDEEYQRLIEKFGEPNTKILIEQLSTGIASKGYKYKSHCATIQSWAMRKFQEHQSKLLIKAKTIA